MCKATISLILDQMEIINSKDDIPFEKKLMYIEKLECWLFQVNEKSLNKELENSVAV